MKINNQSKQLKSPRFKIGDIVSYELNGYNIKHVAQIIGIDIYKDSGKILYNLSNNVVAEEGILRYVNMNLNIRNEY